MPHLYFMGENKGKGSFSGGSERKDLAMREYIR